MQRAFLPHVQKGRTTPAQNLHCTLLFLGETPADKLPELQQALSLISQKHERFVTAFCDTAHFNNGCAVAKLKADKKFVALQKEISAALARYVKNPPKKFVPHVTLFRDAAFDMPFGEVKKCVKPLNAPFEVSGFALFDSVRGKDAMIYTPIAEFELNKNL